MSPTQRLLHKALPKGIIRLKVINTRAKVSMTYVIIYIPTKLNTLVLNSYT